MQPTGFEFGFHLCEAEFEMNLNPEDHCEAPIVTNDGVFVAHYSAKGLAALDFPNEKDVRPAQTIASERIALWHQMTERALKAILSGSAPGELPPLHIYVGTDFQQRVWNALKKIPFGQTQSYGEIAVAVGSRNAVRAVGGACGANPIPVLIPCHRVLAAGNRIGGFSGGLDWKRKLLEREGVFQKMLV